MYPTIKKYALIANKSGQTPTMLDFDSKEKMTDRAEDLRRHGWDVHTGINPSQKPSFSTYEIRYNRHNKKYIVFGIPSHGLWRILKTFDSRKDANNFVSSQTYEGF
jgi:predicted SPOUT superfamily RNA methylase MTH1